MNKAFAAYIILALSALSSPLFAFAQTDKPVVIDAAVTDNKYELYEGNVVKIDKKTRTITFKNNEGESQFVAGPEIHNLR